MNQMGWVYIDDAGHRHRIGLLHGARTGHVLIHCNDKVTLIDFEVHESKSYNMDIDHQICHIDIIKTGEQKYEYAFKINYEADTPLNAARKKRTRKHLWQTLAVVGVVVIALGLLITFLYSSDEEVAMNQALATGNHQAIATVISHEREGELYVLRYAIHSGKSVIESTLVSTDHPQGYLAILPYAPGDEVDVQIHAGKPSLHTIRTGSDLSSLAAVAERVDERLDEQIAGLRTDQRACIIKQTIAEDGHRGLSELVEMLDAFRQNSIVPGSHARAYKRLLKGCKE